MINSVTAATGSGISVNSVGNGRTTVPVPPSSYIYSHFKHISGVPAPEGVRGVSVSKLKILDAMIERLSQMRENRATGVEVDVSEDGGKQLDAVIIELQKQLQSASVASATAPYAPNMQITTGSFFDIAS